VVVSNLALFLQPPRKGLELGASGLIKLLEGSGLGGSLQCARLEHLAYPYLMVTLMAGRDAVGSHMDLIAPVEQVVDRLADTDVGLDAGDEGLPSPGLSVGGHGGLEIGGSAAAKDRLGQRAVFGQQGQDLGIGGAKSFGVMLGHDYRHIQVSGGLQQDCQPVYEPLGLAAHPKQGALKVDDDQHRGLGVEQDRVALGA